MSDNLIKKSFRTCGIGLNTDRSEDNEIAYFQPDQECTDGKNVLSEKQFKLDLDMYFVTTDKIIVKDIKFH